MSKHHDFGEVIHTIEMIFEDFSHENIEEDVHIDTWIRGMPSVRVSWKGSDGICRNITGYILEEARKKVHFEINAWNDRSNKDGEIRYWTNEEIATVITDDKKIVVALSEAHSKVSGLTRKDLDNEKKLDPLDDSQL